MAPAYTQQLLDRAQAYTEQPLTARRSPEGLTELASIYSAITGQPVGSCRQCQYSDFLAAVANYTRSATRFLHPELMSESKYAIAPGLENETFVHESYNKVVTAENLEDKDVEFFKSKGLGKSFVLKSKKDADAAAAAPATDGSTATEGGADATEREQQLTEKVTASEAALKTEKEAHAATKKQLTVAKQQVGEVNKLLAEANKKLAEATKAVTPVAPAEPPITAPPADPGATS
ncbi:MAG: hypothetical protein ACRYG7_13195 [Janthinobacterium lividum]